MKIFSGLSGLESGIAASWTRNSVIQNNIANIDTPNFKASEVAFETLYKNALEGDDYKMKRTRATHMGGSAATGDFEVVYKHDTVQRMDGNNVDVDREMTDYAKNVIWYNTLQAKINGQFNQLRTAIKGQ